jgi:AcrR family transcriptional regulator
MIVYYLSTVGRRRTVSDDEILHATMSAMSRHGPIDMTLAHVAGAVGVTPAALIKRFGSKRGLLLAVSRAGSTGMAAAFAQLRASAKSPLAALIDATTQLARGTRSPEEAAHHLAFLHTDVTDPDFRKPMVEMTRATLAGYTNLIGDAIAKRELRDCDPPTLARVLYAIVGGSMITWAVLRKGSAEACVRADIEAALAPYRVKGRSGVSTRLVPGEGAGT